MPGSLLRRSAQRDPMFHAAAITVDWRKKTVATTFYDGPGALQRASNYAIVATKEFFPLQTFVIANTAAIEEQDHRGRQATSRALNPQG